MTPEEEALIRARTADAMERFGQVASAQSREEVLAEAADLARQQRAMPPPPEPAQPLPSVTDGASQDGQAQAPIVEGPATAGALVGAHRGRLDALEAAYLQSARVRNPMYGPVREYGAESLRQQERERIAVAGQQAAEAERAYDIAAVHQHAVDSARAVLDADAQARAEHERLRAEAMRSIKDGERKVDEATQRLVSAGEIDPERYWERQGAGMQVIAAIGAGLMALGGMDPFPYLVNLVRTDVDAQESNLAKLRGDVAARREQLSQHQQTLIDLRSHYGDDRAARLAMENVRLQQVQAQLARAAAVGDARIVGPRAQQLDAKLAGEVAANKLKIAQLEAANPKYRSVPVASGRAAEVLRSEMGTERKLLEGGETAGLSQLGKIDEERIKQEVKRLDAKDRGGMTPEAFATRLADYGKVRDAHISMEKQISDFLRDFPEGEDIPGVDPNQFIADPEKYTERGKITVGRLKRIFNAYKVAVTGAGASNEELKNMEESVWGANPSHGTVRAGLRALLDDSRARLDNFRAAQDKSVVEYYESNVRKRKSDTEDVGFVAGQ
jgi:hypothetical protein